MKKAFTLIELLVVIAIIALLLSILMPSLATVKELAGSVVCASNGKQVLTAWHMYASENDSKLCGPSTSTYDPANDRYDWVEGTTSDTTVEEEINGTAPLASTGNQGIKGGALYPYYESPKLLHCPTDKRYRKSPMTTSYGGKGSYRSYSFVHTAGGNFSQGFVNNGWLLSEDELIVKITEINNAGSQYVLIEENDSRGINMGSWVMDRRATNLRFVDPFGVFHNMRSIIGFADGHSEKIVWKDERTEEYSDSFVNTTNPTFGSPVWLDSRDLQWLKRNHANRN